MRAPLLAAITVMLLSGHVCAGERLAHNCQCLGKGRSYGQGEIVCLNGHRMQCAMSQNVSSWHVLDGHCKPEDLTASLGKPPWQRLMPGVTLRQSSPLTPM
jgi:hypothetical protein